MVSSNGPTDPPPRIRFNYITTHPSAQDFDYYADLPVIDLLLYEVGWWPCSEDESPHRKKVFPGLWDNDRRPVKRGLRLASLAPLEFDKKPLFPMNRSYCSYLIREAQPMPPDIQSSFVRGPKRWQRKHFPTEALDRKHRWDAPVPPENTPPQQDAKGLPLIYLFNVVVALEWVPDEQDRHLLAWAFRRASDFLYDVSDGSLAFGQVVFITSRDQAQHADIVIAASNRFLGRSWVGSIHERHKRMPLRIGRSEWRRGRSIPWDEPEGYRVIVHEWGHYALHLRDAYLRKIFVQKASGDLLVPSADMSGPYIIAPHPYLVHSTVMEALEGTSELSLQQDRLQPDQTTERSLLHWLYPSSLTADSTVANRGPGSVPFPLPHIVFEETEAPQAKRMSSASKFPKVSFGDRHAQLPGQRVQRPMGMMSTDDGATTEPVKPDYDRCWLYVLSPKDTPLAERRLIAQGTYELRSSHEELALVGAEKDTLLVAVVDQINQGADQNKPVVCGSQVYTSTIGEEANGSQQPVVYRLPPRVIVRPVYKKQELPNGKQNYDKEPEISVSVDLLNDPGNTTLWVCPLMEEVREVTAQEEVPIKGLDGHVVVWCGEQPFIACFSHGGNPPSHTVGGNPGPSGPPQTLGPSQPTSPDKTSVDSRTELVNQDGSGNPVAADLVLVPSITAGSSDGMVRIYFNLLDETKGEYNVDSLRFVTTVQQDATSYTAPRPGARVMSYPFSIACSESCKDHPLRITLEVRYAGLNVVHEAGTIFICRLVEGAGESDNPWQILPTFQFGRFGTAAVATYFDLQCDPASAFFGDDCAPFEQYQLWWIPDEQQ